MSTSDRIVEFLARELSLREAKRCVRIDLVHSPGGRIKDENVRSWSHSEHPQLFEVGCKTTASVIMAAAADYTAEQPSEADRFILRTKQHLGGRSTTTFTLGDDNQ